MNPEVAPTMKSEDADRVAKRGRLKDPDVTKTNTFVGIVFRGGRGGMDWRFDEGAWDTLKGTQATTIRKRNVVSLVRGSEASIVPLRFQRQHNFGIWEGTLPCTGFLRRNGRVIAHA